MNKKFQRTLILVFEAIVQPPKTHFLTFSNKTKIMKITQSAVPAQFFLKMSRTWYISLVKCPHRDILFIIPDILLENFMVQDILFVQRGPDFLSPNSKMVPPPLIKWAQRAQNKLDMGYILPSTYLCITSIQTCKNGYNP